MYWVYIGVPLFGKLADNEVIPAIDEAGLGPDSHDSAVLQRQ